MSKATVTFRNPGFKFTQHDYKGSIEPMFHPMDPIVISMTRILDRPVQVFTGFCDTTPYVQLFPGTCTIEASCTLKRLQYTYWDPGLPFVLQFLESRGWFPAGQKGGYVNSVIDSEDFGNKKSLKDSGFSGLLHDVLVEIGNWPKDAIVIEELPKELIDIVQKLFNRIKGESEKSNKEFTDLLTSIIGTSTATGTSGGTGADAGATDGSVKQNKEYARRLMQSKYGWGEDEFNCLDILWGQRESGWDPEALNSGPDSACGIPQALPCHKLPLKARPKRVGGGGDAAEQIKWGLDYIKGRYGTPCKAKAHSDAHGWY